MPVASVPSGSLTSNSEVHPVKEENRVSTGLVWFKLDEKRREMAKKLLAIPFFNVIIETANRKGRRVDLG